MTTNLATKRWVPVALSAVLLGLVGEVAYADTFLLHSGGRLEGKWLNPQESPRLAYQIRLKAGGEIRLDAKYVQGVRQESESEQRYRELLKSLPDSASSHWQMAQQCLKWGLPKQRKFHLDQVLRLEPDHEEARRALKFKRTATGEWATTEEIQAGAGLVRRDGKWVTQQAADLIDRADQQEQDRLAWQKKLKMWRGWLNDSRRQQRAQDLIESIEDPQAAEAVAKLFWSDKSERVREMLAVVLGRMDSSLATRTLARAALELDGEMRVHCVRQLQRNERTHVAGYFLPYLRSKSNVTVRRAAYALGKLGDEAVVLPLIQALNTSHLYKTGGNGAGINASFDPTGRSGGGLSMGGNKPKTFSKTHTNREALDALVRITKEDFEYSERRWMAWYLAQNTPPALDLRRDP